MSEITNDSQNIALPMSRGRLVIGLVSAGKMGILCTQALVSTGHILGFGYQYSVRTQQRLEYYFPEASASSLEEIVLLSDLIIIAVPQLEIKNILHEIIHLANNNSIVFVISSMVEENLLADLPLVRPRIMIVYPLLSLENREIDSMDLRGSHWIIVAQTEIENVIAQSLVMEIGAVPVIIAPEIFSMFSRTLQQLSIKIEQFCREAKNDISTFIRESQIFYNNNHINVQKDVFSEIADSFSENTMAEEVILPFIYSAVSAALQGKIPPAKFSQ